MTARKKAKPTTKVKVSRGPGKGIDKELKKPSDGRGSPEAMVKKHSNALTYREIIASEPIITRPVIDITDESVEFLGSIGMTLSDVANFFNCSESHISQKHIQALNRGRENLKCSLRFKQVNAALSGNVPMLIHLGKVLLGQNEKQLIQVVPSENPVSKLTDQELLERMNNFNLIEHKPEEPNE